MRARLAVICLALLVPLVAPEGAAACSCVPVNVREAIRESDGAFIGRLVEVRPLSDDPPVTSADPADFIYRVGRVFNGGPGLRRGNRVRVRSVRDEATCGLPDAPGQLIGLFVDRRNRRWHGNLCATTTPRKMRRAGSSAASSPASSPCSAAPG